MSTISSASLVAVFLDTGPLGYATQRPGANPSSDQCQKWTIQLATRGVSLCVPEIADYELRRELLRIDSASSIRRLDQFVQTIGFYVPIDTVALREAARLWAVLRNIGMPTASRDALDGDAILAGLVITWCAARSIPLSSVAVATTNVADLTRFQNLNGEALVACRWQDILV